MISLNLIQSDDESVIEIRKFYILRKRLKDKSTESKINEFDFDFAEKSKIEERWNFWKRKSRKSKIKTEIKSNYDS